MKTTRKILSTVLLLVILCSCMGCSGCSNDFPNELISDISQIGNLTVIDLRSSERYEEPSANSLWKAFKLGVIACMAGLSAVCIRALSKIYKAVDSSKRRFWGTLGWGFAVTCFVALLLCFLGAILSIGICLIVMILFSIVITGIVTAVEPK